MNRSDAFDDLGGTLGPYTREEAGEIGRRATGVARAALQIARQVHDSQKERSLPPDQFAEYLTKQQAERDARDKQLGRY